MLNALGKLFFVLFILPTLLLVALIGLMIFTNVALALIL